jgi:hypothetical protein
MLARLPFRFSALQTLPSPDTPLLGMTLIGEGRAGTPIPFIELGWMSGIREKSTATPK